LRHGRQQALSLDLIGIAEISGRMKGKQAAGSSLDVGDGVQRIIYGDRLGFKPWSYGKSTQDVNPRFTGRQSMG
jgi:hypothetical protein